MSKINKLFKQKLKIVNLGLSGFAKELKEQDIEVLHVDWRPPAGGNEKMIKLLNKLKNK